MRMRVNLPDLEFSIVLLRIRNRRLIRINLLTRGKIEFVQNLIFVYPPTLARGGFRSSNPGGIQKFPRYNNLLNQAALASLKSLLVFVSKTPNYFLRQSIIFNGD